MSCRPVYLHHVHLHKQLRRLRINHGLFSVGEAACVSVHGANRLGGNSLLDLVVFGRAAGLHINEDLKSGGGVEEANSDDIESALHRLNKLNESNSGYEVAEVKRELHEVPF